MLQPDSCACWRLACIVAMAAAALPVWAARPTNRELTRARQWVRTSFMPAASPGAPGPPFSFLYDGKSSRELLGAWEFAESRTRLDEWRTQRTQTYTDPATGLEVRCVGVQYADFPTVEWTVYLRNTGLADTLIVEDLQALDTRFGQGAKAFTLHHNVGSICQANDFEPLETVLGPGAEKRISAAGGRPTNSDLCYFNLEWGEGGAIIGLGWPGQWAAHFLREGSRGVRVVAGQELTHFRLHPGEEVRTPLLRCSSGRAGIGCAPRTSGAVG